MLLRSEDAYQWRRYGSVSCLGRPFCSVGKLAALASGQASGTNPGFTVVPTARAGWYFLRSTRQCGLECDLAYLVHHVDGCILSDVPTGPPGKSRRSRVVILSERLPVRSSPTRHCG